MPRYAATEPVFVNDRFIDTGGEFEVPDGTPVGKAWAPLDEPEKPARKPKADEPLA